MTDLFQAVRLGALGEFRSQIAHADINTTDAGGENLLHQAIAAGRTEIGMELIDRGIDVNHATAAGDTPLHYVAVHKSPLAEVVLRAGGRLDLANRHGNQPLWTAVFNARGDYRLVRLFIEHGADPDHKNAAGRTPRDFANQIRDAALVATLAGR